MQPPIHREEPFNRVLLSHWLRGNPSRSHRFDKFSRCLLGFEVSAGDGESGGHPATQLWNVFHKRVSDFIGLIILTGEHLNLRSEIVVPVRMQGIEFESPFRQIEPPARIAEIGSRERSVDEHIGRVGIELFSNKETALCSREIAQEDE